MKCNLAVLILFFLSSLSISAIDLQTNSSLKYKKVIDIQTGALDTDYCNRDCPKYPGGEEAIVKHVYSQIGVSSESSHGKNPTTVKFLITNTGKIRDISIEKTSNEQYDKEILKAMQSLPNYYASKDNESCYYGWFNVYLP